ncbi:hypothetical protein GCM10009836_60890 [Pseudonocardia ailaonensis]|uniref:Uncharacterized protein n=1 Tax=Pseudonocardia ailaonensis TaxID=367279 RepID=A0ABN2NJI6_9PSEU
MATTAAVIVALWVAFGDRRRQRAASEEEATLQARLITIELTLDAETRSATITLTNHSDRPIFQPIPTTFSIWHNDEGEPSGLSSSADHFFDQPSTPGLTVGAPPREVLHPTERYDVTWSGLDFPPDTTFRWLVGSSFTDASGRRWQRVNHDEPQRTTSP